MLGGDVQLRRKGTTVFGESYYYPDSPVNILSLKQITSVNYEVEIDKKGTWAKILSPDGVVYDFELGSDGLLVCPVDRISRMIFHEKHFTV